MFLRVDKDMKFPTDSSIKVLTAGLLGENYLGIMPGAETEYFVDSDEIELTQSAVILENIISQFLYNFQENKDQERTRKKRGKTATKAIFALAKV